MIQLVRALDVCGNFPPSLPLASSGGGLYLGAVLYGADGRVAEGEWNFW